MADYYTGNYPLTEEQMHVNALYITYQLINGSYDPIKWTYEAVAALLGNTQSESRHNPGAWQDYTIDYDDPYKGYGLTQWTPARKFIEWAEDRKYDIKSMSAALERLYYERISQSQYYPTEQYPETFKEFIQSKKDPYYLAGAFLYNYERPQTPDPDTRGKQALYWYQYITGNVYRKKSNWIYYLRKKVML